MGFNFPNSPIPGQVYSPAGGYSYVWLDGVWRMVQPTQAYVPTAQTRNRIVNSAMQISQETAKGTGIATTATYVADQWLVHNARTAGAFAASISAAGRYFRFLTTTANPTVGAGDVYFSHQPIEGLKVVDFGWGAAGGVQAILYFKARSNISGTFAVSITNGAADRCYVKNLTILGDNVMRGFTVVIPPDTTGVWPTDTAAGMRLRFCVMAGTTSLGTDSIWQAGGYTAAAGISNWMSAANQTFDFTDVGLYLDPLNTGVAPPWVMPDEAEELQACQRYYESVTGGVFAYHASVWGNHYFKVNKRTTPAFTATPTSSGGYGVNLSGFAANHNATILFSWIANARM